jgi:hypothetical protein
VLLVALAGAPAPRAQERGAAGAADESEDAGLRRLGLRPGRDADRLIRGVRRVLQIRRQMGIGGRGEVFRYRDAVEEYARFLKRDTVGLARQSIEAAAAAYARLDRSWVDEMAARIERGSVLSEIPPRDAAKLAESAAIADEIAGHLGEVLRLAGEGERREIELNRTFRNLLLLGEEARRTHAEIEPLGPPPAVSAFFEEIHTTFETEVRPLRAREEGLRALRGRLADRIERPERIANVREMRAAVGKIRAIQRVLEERRGARDH